MSIQQMFFTYFAVMMTGLSLLVVTRRNPVHSILIMLILFVHMAGLYLFLNAEFLAAIQIIVYAGAILVLFLFVIMLLNLTKEEREETLQKEWPVSAGTGLVLTIFFVLIVRKIEVLVPPGEYSIEAIQAEGSLMTMGKVLFTKYLLPFEIASVLLLVAIVGAVVLAKKRVRQ